MGWFFYNDEWNEKESTTEVEGTGVNTSGME